ncbi:MAG: hypothetical protein KAG28_04090 [Cocleimonas sp.]|nr:hypothetical protein [Cocleimonas sp.]
MRGLKGVIFGFLCLASADYAVADPRFSCNVFQLHNAEPLIEDMIDKILTANKLQQRYHVCRVPKYSNVAATVIENKRIIVYDSVYLEKIASEANEEYWGRVTALAHEIGHHRYQHLIKINQNRHLAISQQLALQRQYELQADHFAGQALAGMGASLKNTQALMRVLTIHRNEDFSDHPNVQKRMSAVTQGWNIGCKWAGSNCNSPRYKQRAQANIALSFSATVSTNAYYLQFMRQAEHLKGKRVTRAYCKHYARLATQQTKRAERDLCGFNIAKHGEKNSRWSFDFLPQFNWCLKASAHATAGEAKHRETKLMGCQ